MQTQWPRKLAVWDPCGSNKFVVGAGADIKLYEWVPRNDYIKLLTVQSDLSLMKCFAWSPHSGYSDLIAIGLSTGRIDLTRINANAVSAAQSSHAPTKPSVASLNIQHSRSCNNLSFSPTNPNYLAAGLDKVRGQYSLMIWDVERASQSIVTEPSFNDTNWSAKLPRLSPRPITNNDHGGPLRRYAFADVISSMSFLPSTPYLVAVCAGLRFLRIYDIREPSEPQSSLLFNSQTKAHFGLCYDPFDEFKLASYGDDGGVRIWDRRRIDRPVLAFSDGDTHSDASGARLGKTLTHIAFSPARRGIIGTLEKDAFNIRLWSLMEADPTAVNGEQGHEFGNGATAAIQHLRLDSGTSASSAVEYTSEVADSHLPLLGHTRKGKVFQQPLSSFTFAPNLDGTNGHAYILTVTKEGALDISRPTIAAHHAWSARGELALSTGTAYRSTDDRILPSYMYNTDPWELDIEHSIPPTITQEINNPPGVTAHSEVPPEGEDDRKGRLPFPVVRDSVSTSQSHRQSSLSASRHLNQNYARSPSTMRRLPLTPSTTGNLEPGRAQTVSAARNASRSKSKGRPAEDEHDTGFLKSSAPDDVRPVTRKGHRELAKVMREDISEVMRARVMAGYGLESMIHNASVATRNPITDVECLPGLWRWMDSSRTMMGVESSRVHGFDFTYQGVLSIWEGFPSFPSKNLPAEDKERGTLHSDQQGTHSNLGTTGRTSSGRGHRRPSSRNKSAGDSSRLHYETAIETINGGRTHGVKKDMPSATVHSSKVARRQFALSLFGWDYSDAEFRQVIQRWEESANAERAACWAVLLGNHELAIEILLRSRNEALQMLSGTIKMLVDYPSASERNPWLDHLKRLAVRNTNMYIRTMLSHLVGDGWVDILLQETSIPLRERLAIAFLFLPDDELTKYLRGLVESMKRYGDIEALLITGLNPLALDVIQAYLDNTGDVQTAAVLASCVSPARWKPTERSKAFDNHSERWIEAYQDLLDSWKLFHHRCQFDMLRGEIKLAAIHDGEVTPFEWVPRQLEVRCNYCNKIINSSQPTESGPYGVNGRVKADFCPSCQRKLPRCVICLMTIGVPDEEGRHIELADAISFRDTIDDAMVFCQACRHGGHSGHMLDWFFGDAKGKVHPVCAVADCTCRCTEMF